MQKDQKIKVSSKAEVFSQCSCPECDSASCFVKRRFMEQCTCNRLAASELHTYSSQSSKLVTETKHSISKSPIRTEEPIVHDLKKKHIKSSICEVTQQIISEFMKESNKNLFTDSTTTIFKTSNTSFNQRQGNSRKTSSFTKDSREESKKDKASNVYCYRKKAYREGSESLPKDGACQNMSAAVDHSMLHQELQAPIPKAKISSAIVNLSAEDIYNKIKEAYKACSCEVCKCVVGKSLQNKFCECKPCECHDCGNLSECMLNYIGTEVIQKHDEECFCLLCDKKSCKVLEDSERKLQEYHGHHEELRKCGKDCNCKRCECIKCKARLIHRTLIVAPVGGELQHHNGCRCAPCECFECRHRYGVNTNGQHDISTGVNRHPNCHCEVCDNEACIPDNNQSCRCVRHSKVMSKPVERDSQDYDIHTANVTYNNKGICEGNFETLAMFATLPSSYTKHLDQSKQCSCDHCECLNCEYSNRNNLSPNSYQLDQELNENIKYCKPKVLKQFKPEDRHVLNKCKCIDCDSLVNSGVEDENATKKLNKKCSSNQVCCCNICKMVEHEKTEPDYFKNRSEDASVGLIRLMKSRRQTRLRNKDPLIQSCINTLESNKKIFQQHELSFHASKSSTSIDNFGESHHPTCRQVCYGSHRIFCSDFETDSGVHEHVSECANEIDFRKHNKQTLNSSLSLLSSKSFVKESESVTHVMSKLKSRESSCNSSGYDYPDYLAHFPKLAIKTCLDDVMQCNLSNNDVFKIGSNHNIVTKSTHFNLRDQKSSHSQTSSARSSKNTKLNRKASQTFDIQNYINQIRNFTKETRKTNTLSKCTVNAENEIDKFKTDSSSTSTTNTSAKLVFNEEYVRVQKTLRDAREYSQHLVSLFEKYEKANKEFESVSERIKNSKNCIDRNINTFVVQEVPTKDSECTFTSAFDEIDTINKQENYIDNRDNIYSSEKPVNILKNAIFASNDRGNHNYAFIDSNHTFITEEKETKYVNKHKMSIDKKLNKRLIQVTERTQDVVTPQSSNIDDKQEVLILNNDSVIVLISDSQPSGKQGNFQKSLDTKVIDTGENTNGDCHDKSNVDQTNNSDKLGLENNIKTIEEKEGIIAKRDFHHIISTTLSKNTNLSTKCTTELNNLTKSKSTLKIKTESSKLLLENLHSPKIDMNMNCDNLKHPSCFIVSLPPPHESDGKTATEVISQQPVDEHADDKSKSLKSNNIVHTTTESSKLLLENLDIDQNSGKLKDEDVVSLPPSHETDEKAATEVMSHQPVDEHYVNTSKALEMLQTEVKRILDLPFLQVVKRQKCNHDLNCEAMKVTTLVAHRISDHSVAMKWKAPSLASNVTGYEVLIDGRFVQKITNPSRRMAVLCCLPHAEKVLLTVRSVVAVSVSDHYPAVTLVYHTRIKSETLQSSDNV